MSTKGYVVIGWLYNNNGMGTWCIEAAHSLYLCGYTPVVVKRPGTTYQPAHPCIVAEYSITPVKHPVKRILRLLSSWVPVGRLRPQTADFVPAVTGILAKQDIHPICFLLNQSSLVSNIADVPQWVAGWAWPLHFGGYFAKVFTPSSMGFAARIRENIFWYRMDNYGYRRATGVLSVTAQLHMQLVKMQVNSLPVWPGMADPPLQDVPGSTAEPPTLFIAALGLEDKRKHIAWIIKNLTRIPAGIPFRLVLAGSASPAFRQWVHRLLPNAEFTGLLARQQLLQQMSRADIFLFASVVEDWGYVQVEAMAMGLVVFAPAKLPCTEIVSNPHHLYIPNHTPDFVQKLTGLLQAGSTSIASAKARNRQRFQQHFSAQAFGSRLQQAIEQHRQAVPPPVVPLSH